MSVVSAAVALGFFLLWELGAQTGWIPRIFFPAPSAIVQALVKLVATGTMGEHLSLTLYRIGAALVVGGGLGLAAGWALGASRTIRAALEPFVSALHPLPKMALFPLFLVVLGIGEESRIAVIAVSVLFPVLINTQAGIRQIDQTHWDVARNYGAGPLKRLLRVVLPGSLPMTLVGFKLGFNTATMITIAVEMLSARNGLGALIWDSWNSLRTTQLFAVLFVVMALGIAANALFTVLFKKMIPWQQEETR